MVLPISDAPAERLALDPTSELWGEHRSRYLLAGAYAPGMRVLDAACGSGFGSQMLQAAGARQVVAVDVSAEALAGASARFGSRGVHFLRANLASLPFPSASFDLVVSMETIEHVIEPRRVLAEFARCLRPDGRLVLSTPNRDFRPTADGRPGNPHHLREYSPAELETLLQEWFHVRLLGQQVDRFYAAVPYLLGPGDTGLRSWRAVRLIPWKLANRLPHHAKDALSQLLFGRSFYPTERDYAFTPEAVASAHDLLALATPRA
jgi:SAM-dependent methyltransferase